MKNRQLPIENVSPSQAFFIGCYDGLRTGTRNILLTCIYRCSGNGLPRVWWVINLSSALITFIIAEMFIILWGWQQYLGSGAGSSDEVGNALWSGKIPLTTTTDSWPAACWMMPGIEGRPVIISYWKEARGVCAWRSFRRMKAVKALDDMYAVSIWRNRWLTVGQHLLNIRG